MSAPTKQRAGTREAALAELGAAFKGAMGAIRRLRGRDTHRHGELSFAQYQLLSGLSERNELSAGELALAADLSPATVTQLLDSLAEMGLVERTRSERDRRVVTCTLTTRGRELITARRVLFEQRWQTALADFSAKEIATAAAVDRPAPCAALRRARHEPAAPVGERSYVIRARQSRGRTLRMDVPVSPPVCSTCAAEAPEGARFCPQCGTELGGREDRLMPSAVTWPMSLMTSGACSGSRRRHSCSRLLWSDSRSLPLSWLTGHLI